MNRLVIIAVMVFVGTIAYVQYAPRQSAITITDAQAIPIKGADHLFMVSLRMKNKGPTATLTDVNASADSSGGWSAQIWVSKLVYV